MNLRAVKPQHETRTRILDAAEELFMQHGFEGTSMRLLTAKAGVNLAAVNYHFGSKHALVEAVFRRRLDPMNAARLAELDKLEAAERVPSPESVIRAFIAPGLRLMEDAKGGGRNFVRLLGRTYNEPNKAVRALIGQMYAPTMQRYKAALERALPQMPREELVWRMQDRKSTRLNSCHSQISYAVFCLKKKNSQTDACSSGSTSTAGTARTPAATIPSRKLTPTTTYA